MVPKIGWARLVVIGAILVLYLAAAFALNGFDVAPRQQAQVPAHLHVR